MARIQLRDTTMYIQDGLSGAGVLNDSSPADLTGVTNLTVASVVLNSDVTDQVPVGARFTIAGETGLPIHTVTARTPSSGTTTSIDFEPAVASNVADDAAVTFLPQRISIRIGDGDITWTEAREVIYDLDRDLLDDVRLGPEQPMEVNLAFVFEWVTTESGQEIAPIDAIKRTGEATEWVSSDADQCRPYAVDLYLVHCVPCATDQDQDFLFPDFRYDDLQYSVQDSSISVTGRCNATDAITTRADLADCA